MNRQIRIFMLLALVAVFSVAVSACGSDSEDGESDQSLGDGDTPEDGDSPAIDGDGDRVYYPDGDTPEDGDAPADGDTPDGDSSYYPPDGEAPEDGDTPTDGDVPMDGDIPDGDIEYAEMDADQSIDGDMDMEFETGEEPEESEQPEEPEEPEEPVVVCPEEEDPLVLYLSSDDSNSVASPVIIRSMLKRGGIPNLSQVRIWEFLNYYHVSYPAPIIGDTIALYADMNATEDAADFSLQLAARSYDLASRAGRPMNLTFILDTSGSMSGKPIERMRAVCRAIASQLNRGDIVSMVTWSNGQNVVMNGHVVDGPDDSTLLAEISAIRANGGTNLYAGLVKGYELAQESFSADRLNRTILISDGRANVGQTDINIISSAALDNDGQGIYLVGVGVGEGFNDTLMDRVTDAGRGAYVYIDSNDEAQKMFANRFFENMDLAARAVRMEVTLPWYFVMKEFHGEEYSENPEEIEPQHLAPNDAMVFHQIVTACDTDLMLNEDEITAKVQFTQPSTGQRKEITKTLTIGEMLAERREAENKGDAIVLFAQLLEKGYDRSDEHKEEITAAIARFDDLFDQTSDTDYLEFKEQLELLRGILNR